MPTTRSSGVAFADDDLEGTEQVISQLGLCELEVTRRIPNIFERVRTLIEQNGGDPSAMTRDDIVEILAFCQYHDIEAGEAAALATASLHQVRKKRGFWQSILLLLQNFDEGDPETPQAGPIPIAEIHVPGIAGCEGHILAKSWDFANSRFDIKGPRRGWRRWQAGRRNIRHWDL